jgi:hypothetical protein
VHSVHCRERVRREPPAPSQRAIRVVLTFRLPRLARRPARARSSIANPGARPAAYAGGWSFGAALARTAGRTHFTTCVAVRAFVDNRPCASGGANAQAREGSSPPLVHACA